MAGVPEHKRPRAGSRLSERWEDGSYRGVGGVSVDPESGRLQRERRSRLPSRLRLVPERDMRRNGWQWTTEERA